MIVERIRHNGTLVLSESVTDGYSEWLETQRYVGNGSEGWTEEEAREAFDEHLRRNNLTRTED